MDQRANGGLKAKTRQISVTGSIYRNPAPDLPLERALVAALLMSEAGRTEALEELSLSMFSDQRTRTLYQVIRDMTIEGKEIDAVLLNSELLARNLQEAAGGFEFYARTLDETPHGLAVDYARVLAKRTSRARLSEALYKAWKASENGNTDPEDIWAEILSAIGPDAVGRRIWWIRDLLADFNPERHKTRPSERGIPETGIPDLDKTLTVFKESSLTVVAGRPAMGKSSFMRQMALSAAKAGPILIFTLEESRDAVTDKMLASMSSVEYWRWYYGRSSKEEDLRMVAVAGMLANLPIAFYGDYSVDAARIRLAVKRLVDEGKKPSAVFVDHLQLMRHPKMDNRDQALGETTRELRLLALDSGVPVILLCQMNRSIDTREEKKPRLSDLRESGNIEANAPNVIFLWHDRDADPAEITLTVAKHRDGPTAEINLVFLRERGVFMQGTKS